MLKIHICTTIVIQLLCCTIKHCRTFLFCRVNHHRKSRVLKQSSVCLKHPKSFCSTSNLLYSEECVSKCKQRHQFSFDFCTITYKASRAIKQLTLTACSLIQTEGVIHLLFRVINASCELHTGRGA